MNSKKISQVKVNRTQIMDLIASHLHAMGISPRKEIDIVDIAGMPNTEMLIIRYKTQEEAVMPTTTAA